MKTDLLNGFLCGNEFEKNGIRTKPLISRPGAQSVTSVPCMLIFLPLSSSFFSLYYVLLHLKERLIFLKNFIISGSEACSRVCSYARVL